MVTERKDQKEKQKTRRGPSDYTKLLLSLIWLLERILEQKRSHPSSPLVFAVFYSSEQWNPNLAFSALPRHFCELWMTYAKTTVNGGRRVRPSPASLSLLPSFHCTLHHIQIDQKARHISTHYSSLSLEILITQWDNIDLSSGNDELKMRERDEMEGREGRGKASSDLRERKNGYYSMTCKQAISEHTMYSAHLFSEFTPYLQTDWLFSSQVPPNRTVDGVHIYLHCDILHMIAQFWEYFRWLEGTREGEMASWLVEYARRDNGMKRRETIHNKWWIMEWSKEEQARILWRRIRELEGHAQRKVTISQMWYVSH